MKRIVLAIIAAISCNLATAAEPVAYVSASVGSAEQKLSFDGINLSENDTAFQVAGGYFFAPNVGVEVGYTNLGKAEIGDNAMKASSKPQAVHLALIGAWNLAPQFAITGKLGVANTHTKLVATDSSGTESDTEKHTSLMFGLGANYAVNPQVSVFAEYQNFGKIAKDEGVSLKAQVVSVGLRYNF